MSSGGNYEVERTSSRWPIRGAHRLPGRQSGRGHGDVRNLNVLVERDRSNLALAADEEG